MNKNYDVIVRLNERIRRDEAEIERLKHRLELSELALRTYEMAAEWEKHMRRFPRQRF